MIRIMNTKINALIGIYILLALITGCVQPDVNQYDMTKSVLKPLAPTIKTDLSYENLKAISLRELQKRITNGDDQDIAEIKSFYDITRLYGFLWDSEGKDLILLGETNASGEKLFFDDFVVAISIS